MSYNSNDNSTPPGKWAEVNGSCRATARARALGARTPHLVSDVVDAEADRGALTLLQSSCSSRVCVCVSTPSVYPSFFFFFLFSIERFDRIELKLMTTMRKGQQCGGDDLWPGVSVCECVWIYYPIIFRWMKSDRAVAWPTRWMAYVANIWYSSSIINH